MRVRGLEPPRAGAQRDLNPPRLPIPPHPRGAQAVLAVLLRAGRAELWHLLVLSALYGAAEAFWRPASTGLIPSVVSPGRLQQANALMAVTVNLAYVVGPAIAGVLVAGAGA